MSKIVAVFYRSCISCLKVGNELESVIDCSIFYLKGLVYFLDYLVSKKLCSVKKYPNRITVLLYNENLIFKHFKPIITKRLMKKQFFEKLLFLTEAKPAEGEIQCRNEVFAFAFGKLPYKILNQLPKCNKRPKRISPVASSFSNEQDLNQKNFFE